MQDFLGKARKPPAKLGRPVKDYLERRNKIISFVRFTAAEIEIIRRKGRRTGNISRWLRSKLLAD